MRYMPSCFDTSREWHFLEPAQARLATAINLTFIVRPESVLKWSAYCLSFIELQAKDFWRQS